MDIETIAKTLTDRALASNAPREVLRAPELKALYEHIKTLPSDERGSFGKRVNELKQALELTVSARQAELEKIDLPPIDVTAPMDVNTDIPPLLPSDQGTIHPLSVEIERISDIFNRMGYCVEESREIDDQFHMFESLNFPKGHPARDDYDTFMTEQTDVNGDRLIAPAHSAEIGRASCRERV